MNRVALLLLPALAACRVQNAAEQHYGFLALLGRDTVSVERVTRTADTVVSDEVDRFPRVRQRHTRIVLRAGGAIRHLEMDIHVQVDRADRRALSHRADRVRGRSV